MGLRPLMACGSWFIGALGLLICVGVPGLGMCVFLPIRSIDFLIKLKAATML